MERNVCEIIEEVKAQICDEYCKHMEYWRIFHSEDDIDGLINEECDKCPLNRL